MNNTLELTKSLMSLASITPDDRGCQALMIQRLEKIGFKIERLPFGKVENFWARKGTQQPVFAFAGHTDVVPTGAREQWDSDPFIPTIKNGQIYGRGAADMKGSLAAMVVAVENFYRDTPAHNGSIAFLITSDEEGPAIDGTQRVMKLLTGRGEKIDWCLIGEPSSSETLGDTVKNGRRGSLTGELIVYGHQGHIAYPHLADNPIHRFVDALKELTQKKWDAGNSYFPPTSFQVSNLNSGVGAGNVIPGELNMLFNFRYSTETNEIELKNAVETILDSHTLRYKLEWTHFGKPFFTEEAELTKATIKAITDITGRSPILSTTGGTSDGRFIAPYGVQVVELGPLNASIHKVNEHTDINDLETLTQIYTAILRNLLV